MVEQSRDYALFILDPSGRIMSWNLGAERLKGYAADEIIGRHFSTFYTQEAVESGWPAHELQVATVEGRFEDEGWRVKKNGERFWARVMLTAVTDDDGHLRGFAKVTQDLTERRHAQVVEKAAKNVNEFIAMLAHELRNPLAPIRTAVQVMAKAPHDAETVDAMRQTIDRQSAQLARIVDDMIDIARITKGSLVIEHQPVELGDVVRRAVETAAPAIEAARHALDLDVPDSGFLVYGDRDRLTQLLSNLLNNAARYTPPGGRISVRVRREDGHALLTVHDTGRGIEPQVMDRIFDMFVQGRSPLERVGGGLGIGLALARRIAELHGGTLHARSEGEGKGSELILRLPLSPVKPAPERERADAPARAAGPRRA